MNQDGKLDLIAGNSVLAGLGDGTFRFPVFFGLTTEICNTFSGCQVTGDFAAVVADFNGDGVSDIAEALNRADYIGPHDAEVAILLNDSPGDGFLATGLSAPSSIWPTGATSMVSAFGINLAPTTVAAPDSAFPPTTLGGIRVHLLDRVGTPPPMSVITERLAPLFYVSPGQINFEVSTNGPFVYISIEHVGLPYIPKGLNSSSLAAATAVRVAFDGSLTSVPVTSCLNSTCAATPVNVTKGSVYLCLYGTGFGAVSSTTAVSCTAGGAVLQPTYAGPQMQIPGLDQINVLLPTDLAGAGNITVQCSFGAAMPAFVTNPVNIAIQ